MYKKILTLFLIIVSTACHAGKCDIEFTTQSQMNECAHEEYVNSDKELDKIYKKILEKYKNYPAAYSRSVKAEKKWIEFRDAQVKMKFPPLKNGGRYGSIHPVFEYDYLHDLTDQRINQLKEILKDTYVDELNEWNS